MIPHSCDFYPTEDMPPHPICNGSFIGAEPSVGDGCDDTSDFWKLYVHEDENGDLVRTLIDDKKSSLTLQTEEGELEIWNLDNLTPEESLAVITGALDSDMGSDYIRSEITSRLGIEDVGQDMFPYLSQLKPNEMSEILNGQLSASINGTQVNQMMSHINENGGITLDRLSEGSEVRLGLYEFMRMSGNNSQSMFDHLESNLYYTGDKTGWYLDLGDEYTSTLEQQSRITQPRKGWEPETTEWFTNNGVFGMAGTYSMLNYYGESLDSIDPTNTTYDHLNNQQFNINSTSSGRSFGQGTTPGFQTLNPNSTASTVASAVEMASSGFTGMIASYMNGTTMKLFESQNGVPFTTLYTQDFSFNWDFPSSEEMITNRSYQNMYRYMNMDDGWEKNYTKYHSKWQGWDYDMDDYLKKMNRDFSNNYGYGVK